METEAAPRGLEGVFEKRICEYKARNRPEDLAAYLQDILAGPDYPGLPVEFKAKLSNERGWALLQLERVAEARHSYEQSLQIDPGNVTARYNLANLDMHANDLVRAMHRYGDLLADVPDHAGALYNKALCHVLREEVDLAGPLFERVTRIEPDYLGAQFWLGECRLRRNMYAEALESFQKVLALDGGHTEARRGAAICCLKTGAYREAVGQCEALLEDTGPELTALRIKGDAHLALGEVEEGVRCHLDMAFIEFDAREFLINRARQLSEENPGIAGYYCQRILEHFPDFEPALKPFLGQADNAPLYLTETGLSV